MKEFLDTVMGLRTEANDLISALELEGPNVPERDEALIKLDEIVELYNDIIQLITGV